jgi:hypothetical protein
VFCISILILLSPNVSLIYQSLVCIRHIQRSLILSFATLATSGRAVWNVSFHGFHSHTKTSFLGYRQHVHLWTGTVDHQPRTMWRHNQIVNGGSSSAIEHVHRIVHFAVVPIATGHNHAPVAGGVVRGTILEHGYRSLDFPLSHVAPPSPLSTFKPYSKVAHRAKVCVLCDSDTTGTKTTRWKAARPTSCVEAILALDLQSALRWRTGLIPSLPRLIPDCPGAVRRARPSRLSSL